jgi:hypothetical protein
LKIPKGLSQSVNQRRKENIMGKGKEDNRTNNDLQNTPQMNIIFVLFRLNFACIDLRKKLSNYTQ